MKIGEGRESRGEESQGEGEKRVVGGLGIFDEELCGDAAALIEEDGSGSDDGVDDGGGVVADGNEL